MVETHAERLQVPILFLAQFGDGKAANRLDVGQIVSRLRRDSAARARGCTRRDSRPRENRPTRPRISCARARTDTARLWICCAGVVVVELARDVAALPLEQRRDRIAERRLAAMADVQRSGRIGGDEFDDRPVRRRAHRCAHSGPLPGSTAATIRCRAEALSLTLIKPGPATFGVSIRSGSADSSATPIIAASSRGLRLRGLREHERDVRRIVAVRRVARPVDRDLDAGGAGNQLANDAGERRLDFESWIDGRGRARAVRRVRANSVEYSVRHQANAAGSTSSAQRTRDAALSASVLAPVRQERLHRRAPRALHEHLPALEAQRAATAQAAPAETLRRRCRRRSNDRARSTARVEKARRRPRAHAPLRRAARCATPAAIARHAARRAARRRTGRNRAARAQRYERMIRKVGLHDHCRPASSARPARPDTCISSAASRSVARKSAL